MRSGKNEKQNVLGRESSKSKTLKRASEAHLGCAIGMTGADTAR